MVQDTRALEIQNHFSGFEDRSFSHRAMSLPELLGSSQEFAGERIVSKTQNGKNADISPTD
jgi:hypothetical protein